MTPDDRRTRAASLAFLALFLGCQVYDESLLVSKNQGGMIPPDSQPVGTAGSSCLNDPVECAGAGNGGDGGAAGASGEAGTTAGGGGAGEPIDATVEVQGGMAGSTGGMGGTGTAGTGGTAGAGGRDASLLDAEAGCADSAAACAVDAPSDVDLCPNDPSKTAPGQCGCGKSDADQDSDGVADCADQCVTDPKKSAPGICGCTRPDPPATGTAVFCLKALMVHRYGFNGTGTTLTDSIGAAHGTAAGGANATQASGTLSLSGNISPGYTSEGYGALPTNLLTGLSDATFEVWVTWKGAASSGGGTTWQRIFDFGDQVAQNGTFFGHTYLHLAAAGAEGRVRAAYSLTATGGEIGALSTDPLPMNVRKHIAVVFDYSNRKMLLYVDGAFNSSATVTSPLSAITNVNSWLGRSLYQPDPEFYGLFHEFRMYGVALTAAQIKTSYEAGPDNAELQ